MTRQKRPEEEEGGKEGGKQRNVVPFVFPRRRSSCDCCRSSVGDGET